MVILILWVYKPKRLSELKMTENINFFYAFAANPGFIEIPSCIRVGTRTWSVSTCSREPAGQVFRSCLASPDIRFTLLLWTANRHYIVVSVTAVFSWYSYCSLTSLQIQTFANSNRDTKMIRVVCVDSRSSASC